MGKTTTVRKPRKATFNTLNADNKRLFVPVNRHAKAFATVLGKKELSVTDLKNVKKAGFRTYHYVDGQLKAIAL